MAIASTSQRRRTAQSGVIMPTVKVITDWLSAPWTQQKKLDQAAIDNANAEKERIAEETRVRENQEARDLAEKNYQRDLAEKKAAQEHAEHREDTAIQRAVASAIAAGLNPAFIGSGASTSVFNPPTSPSPANHQGVSAPRLDTLPSNNNETKLTIALIALLAKALL